MKQELDFKRLADNLFCALDDGIFCDFRNVESVFSKLRTNDDFMKLNDAFGIRKSTYCPYVISFIELNLNDWIIQELTEKEVGLINHSLRFKGITLFIEPKNIKWHEKLKIMLFTPSAVQKIIVSYIALMVLMLTTMLLLIFLENEVKLGVLGIIVVVCMIVSDVMFLKSKRSNRYLEKK